MLNKEVCKVCNRSWDMLDDAGFEDWWRYGEIYCRPVWEKKGKRMSIDSDPPRECPYLTEHVVSQEC